MKAKQYLWLLVMSGVLLHGVVSGCRSKSKRPSVERRVKLTKRVVKRQPLRDIEPPVVPDAAQKTQEGHVVGPLIKKEARLFLESWWHSSSQFSVVVQGFGATGEKLSWTRTCRRDGKPDKVTTKTYTLGQYGWVSRQVLLYGWKRECTLDLTLGKERKKIVQNLATPGGEAPTGDAITFYRKWHRRDSKAQQLAVIFSVRTATPNATIRWEKSCTLHSERNPEKTHQYKAPNEGKTNRYRHYSRLVLLHSFGDYKGACKVVVSTDGLKRSFHFDFD